MRPSTAKIRPVTVFPVLAAISAVAALTAFGADDSGTAAAAAAAGGSDFDWRRFLAPFHNVTLHLPIGFVLLAAILDSYYVFRPSEGLRRGVTIAIIVSAISAALVASLGYLRAAGGGYDPAILHTHKVYGVGVAILTTVLAIVEIAAYRREGRTLLKVAYRALLVADVAVIGIAGHYGGHLTHGSKYLVQNAPDWAREWIKGMDQKLVIGNPVIIEEPVAPTGGGVYADKIRPIFEAKCFQCHGPEKQKGDYRLDNPEDALAAGESELPAIVPFRPRASYLVDLITLPRDADDVMPPDGKESLTAEETLAIIRWIHTGAPFSDGDAATVVTEE